MAKKQTILMLNGRPYDALTGQAVDHRAVRPSGRLITDVVGTTAKQPTLSPIPARTASQPLAPISSTKLMDVTRTTGHVKPRQPQRASTLVRSAVSKPKPGLKSQTKVSAPTVSKSVLAPQTTVAPKLSVGQVNSSRHNRATQTPKSQAISKFSAKSYAATPAVVPQAAAAVRIESPTAVQTQPVPQDSDELFERAMAAADALTQHSPDTKKSIRQARKQARQARKPVRHHTASVVAASLAVLVIGSLVGLHNKTALTLRFANAQAGFSASLPTYQPEGYGIDSFSYSAGNVGTSFEDTANGRDYSLNQQTTKWDSQALLDTYVASNYPNYQALQSGNQIIYVYGKNDASWIKNGIWYQLTSNGNLSTSQVLNIAASV